MSVGNIRAMYQASHSSGSGSHGIEGYYIQKKYLDPAKMKEEKLYASKSKSISVKPVNVSEKKTFIDEVKKNSARLPGPCNYDTTGLKHKGENVILPGNRKTIFDEIGDFHKKHNFPASVHYHKADGTIDKSKLRSNLGKAQNSNFLESQMRCSIDSPGVGNYNAHHKIFEEQKGNRWVEGKQRSKSEAKTKLPPVGTYDPSPVSFNLFSSIGSLSKSKSKSVMGKEERFKSSKKRDVPYHSVISEWGVDKKKNKDILNKVSKTASHRSVYY